MFGRIFIAAVVLLVASHAAVSRAQFEVGGAPYRGLLLLKNGKTLSGDITRSGDYYIVAAPDSEINIRLTEAEAVCRDLEDAYRRKAAATDARSAESHAGLAEWCIEQGLFGNAARELTAAYRLDDTHPKLKLLERRLKAEMSEPKAPPEPAAPPSAPAVSDEELEKTARSVSPEMLQEFTVRVQPLLVNYCATAGCHGPKPGSDFHLHRVYLNERNDLRLVRMNLHSVLSQLDRGRPAQSPLLTKTLGPHGGAKKAQFDAHNADHYRILAAWVVRAAAGTPAPKPTTTAATTPAATGALMQRLPIEPPANGAIAPTPSTPPQPAAPPSGDKPQPVDPFDPAPFNQPRE